MGDAIDDVTLSGPVPSRGMRRAWRPAAATGCRAWMPPAQGGNVGCRPIPQAIFPSGFGELLRGFVSQIFLVTEFRDAGGSFLSFHAENISDSKGQTGIQYP